MKTPHDAGGTIEEDCSDILRRANATYLRLRYSHEEVTQLMIDTTYCIRRCCIKLKKRGIDDSTVGMMIKLMKTPCVYRFLKPLYTQLLDTVDDSYIESVVDVLIVLTQSILDKIFAKREKNRLRAASVDDDVS